MSSCLRQNLFVASLDTSLPDIEMVFVEKSISCVPVVVYKDGIEPVLGERSQRKRDPSLLGIVSRSDVLREHSFYSSAMRLPHVTRNPGDDDR